MYILIVEDESDTGRTLARIVEKIGHTAVLVDNGGDALAKLGQGDIPVILLDIKLPDMDGLEILRQAKQAGSKSDFILVTGHGSVDVAVQSFRDGAYDFIEKPVNPKALSAVIGRAVEHQALLRENHDLSTGCEKVVQEATGKLKAQCENLARQFREQINFGEIITASKQFKGVVDAALRCHEHPESTVLIEGETGTGKDLIAKLIHYGKQLAAKPFVDINCAAVSRDLFENEIFGHEGGAFTGSSKEGKLGKLEMAAGGTLVLDEISDLPLDLQPKLLRVLQERSFYRIGGGKKLKFDARLICISNRPLEELVKEGKFRQDLFYRISVARLMVPPLRERKEAIPAIAMHILVNEAKRKRRKFAQISPAAMKKLVGHEWLGNVRELENALERAVLNFDSETLEAEHLTLFSAAASSCPAVRENAFVYQPDGQVSLPKDGVDMQKMNAALVRETMTKFDGNQTQAARFLNLDRHALRRRLEAE